MAKIMVGIPVRDIHGDVCEKTRNSIDRMRSTSPHSIELRLVRGQQISQNSFNICKMFLEGGFDYLLYTGDDIVFPPWALDRLLAHNKDFTAGVCTWKTPPYWVPAGMLGKDGKFRHLLIRPDHVKNNVLLEVDGVGSGFILIKRNVVEKVWNYLQNEVYPSIPKKHRWLSPIPFFPAVRDPDTGDVFSSDFAFARLAREVGTKIFLDCGLICRHRWQGEYDITDHWDWIQKYGFAKQEEQYFGDEVPFASVDEDSVFWGKAGPPVPLTITSAGNQYHTEAHIWPLLDCMYESILEQKPSKTNVGYIIGWHVTDDASWQVYSNWASRYAKVLIHWVGSDLHNINKWLSPERLTHMNTKHYVHIVEDERLLPEARQYFEKVEVCPLPTMTLVPVSPLPEKFAVAIYYPQQRHDFHYGDVMVEVMKKMPDVQFFLYHLLGKKPEFELPNMVWLGSLAQEDMGTMLANTSCMLRLSKHDGRPYSIVEAAIAGRRFITNFDMKFTNRVSDVPTADEVVAKLNEIRQQTEPDYKTSRYYLNENNPLLFKSRIRKLAGIAEPKDYANGYDYTDFWENRYADGSDYAGTMNDERDPQVRKFVLDSIKDNKYQSVLDVGCGTAALWDALPVKDYAGVDISPTAIRVATERHPDGKFFIGDAARDVLPPADLVLALGLFNFIKPVEFDGVLAKLLTAAKKQCITTVTLGGDRKLGYQFEVPDISLWETDGWSIRTYNLMQGTVDATKENVVVALVVLTKGKEAKDAQRIDSSDPVLQSV